MDSQEQLKTLRNIFSPSAPIEQQDLFFGRTQEIGKVTESIKNKGQHAVLYGERGVGKTSLANIIHKIIQYNYPDAIAVKVTCNRNDNFKSVWKRALSKVKFTPLKKEIGFQASYQENPTQLDLFLPQRENIHSTDLENIFEQLGTSLLFIFDEYDSIKDEDLKERFADAIKSFSDNCPKVTVLLVGIASDVNNLIGNHQSLERCLHQIYIPRMHNEELKEIIEFGFKKLNLRVEDGVKNKIINYSSGFPHYTHLLSMYSAEYAIKRNKHLTDHYDFDDAIKKSIDNALQQIRNDFQTATISSKKAVHYENVLYALAYSNTDVFDCSSTNQILEKFREISGENATRERVIYYLNEMSKYGRGNILDKVGTSKNVKYKFKNSLMKSYVKMKLYDKQNTKYQNNK